MNFTRWHKLRWLTRLLTVPVPETSRQVSRILSVQRNFILPAKLLVASGVLYYLFFSHHLLDRLGTEDPLRVLVLETLQRYFNLYLLFNGIAAILLILRRFPPAMVRWVLFTVGLLDGLLLAGLSMLNGGFESNLFWIFPALIVINASSIPLATPQIVLNLTLSAFYLGAGLLNASISDSANLVQYAFPFPQKPKPPSFSAGDIDSSKLPALAVKLSRPARADGVSQYLSAQLSPATGKLLSDYTGGLNLELKTLNLELKRALVDDFNRIIKAGPLYEPDRFASVKLSPATANLLAQNPRGLDLEKLNRLLLLDAYSQEIAKSPYRKFMDNKQKDLMLEAAKSESGPESFVLRLMILWLLTVSCYGLQLLAFRQRLAEEEVQKSVARNDELKAAGRLAAEIAHQLKNPLGIINNAAFSVQRALREGKSDFGLQIEIIREEIERSDRILTQLMGYAQLSEGRVEKLNLTEELDRAIAEVLPPGANYATQTHRDYGPDLPALLVQRSHLSVVLVNLLQNAREALNGHGNILVRARCPDGNSVQIEVADDGPGIPPDLLGRIFEAYFSSKEKGTGLGLAIVKHNVELYGGMVRVESEVGKGACFTLLFPAKTLIKVG